MTLLVELLPTSTTVGDVYVDYCVRLFLILLLKILILTLQGDLEPYYFVSTSPKHGTTFHSLEFKTHIINE